MRKCPTHSRNLKINHEILTLEWPHGQWNSAACVRARRSGTFELMQHNHERSTSVLHHTRGITYAAGLFILSLSFLYGNRLQTNCHQHYSTVLCCCCLSSNMDEKTFVKLVLVKQSLHMSVCTF